MSDAIIDTYDRFAVHYRALLQPREHFRRQRELLLKLFSLHDVTPSARILDAACGTCDVLTDLHQLGFRSLMGIDGSAEMLREARRLEVSSNVELRQCAWEGLEDVFEEVGRFRCIYILGHALPHADIRTIPGILQVLCNGLLPGGLLAFDLRKWERDTAGDLVQPGRPPGEIVECAESSVDGFRYMIENRCEYREGRQISIYGLRSLGGSAPEHGHEFSLSFSIFTEEQALQWMEDAGLTECNIRQYPGWPYLVATGRRPVARPSATSAD